MYELPLADELFLVGHDQYSGKPQINDGALETALARLRYRLDRPGNLDEQTAVLGSLVLASGLEFVLGGGTGRETRDALSRMHQMLKTDLQALVVGVESAVAQIALSGRR